MKEVADDARSKEEMLKHLVSALLYYTYMFIQGYFYHALLLYFFPVLETPGINQELIISKLKTTAGCILKMTEWCKRKTGPSHFSIHVPVRRNNTG